MTGISSSYEAPTNPNLEIFTEVQTVEESVKTIITFLEKKLN
jgi:adenylylsulfate kinase